MLLLITTIRTNNYNDNNNNNDRLIGASASRLFPREAKNREKFLCDTPNLPTNIVPTNIA